MKESADAVLYAKIPICLHTENIFSPKPRFICELLIGDMRKKKNTPLRMREPPCMYTILRQFNWCTIAVIQASAALSTRQGLPILQPIGILTNDFSIVGPKRCNFSVYYELIASACFGKHLLIIRRLRC
jgi:hypothetical protein